VLCCAVLCCAVLCCGLCVAEYRRSLKRGPRLSLISASPLAILTAEAGSGAGAVPPPPPPTSGGAAITPSPASPAVAPAHSSTPLAAHLNPTQNQALAALLVNKARMLHVHVMEGLALPAMDKNGLSDPFAVLKVRTAVEVGRSPRLCYALGPALTHVM
jgi:hypothetical protein